MRCWCHNVNVIFWEAVQSSNPHFYMYSYTAAVQSLIAICFADFLLIKPTLCCFNNCSCCSGLHLRSSWLMPLIPAHYYRRRRRLSLGRKANYQNALKGSITEVNPQEVRDQSRTSVVVWLVFSLPSLLASEHRWRFICCLLPLDSFSFSIPISVLTTPTPTLFL